MASMKDLAAMCNSNEVLVVGVGNPQRGDDAAGLVLGRALADKLGMQYLHCEEVPENYLAEMRNTPAATVMFVDAADMGVPAGEIRLLEPQQLAGSNISTHNCSLSLLAKLLTTQCNKRVVILAIQPASLEWQQCLTEPVAQAIDRFVAALPAGAQDPRLCNNERT